MSKNWLLTLPLTLLIGCSGGDDAGGGGGSASGPKEDTAEATVLHIMDGVRNGHGEVAWEALPASYQEDLNGLVKSFAEGMNPQMWKQITDVVASVHKLTVDKKEFIMNHPAVAESDDPETAKKSIDQVSGLLKTILDAAGDLEKLKSFDGGEFMKTTGSSLITQLDALSKLAPQQAASGPVGLAAIDSVKVETVTSSDSSATLKIIQPDGKEETQEFIKVEGKWIPKDMADGWESQIAAAKISIADLPNKAAEMQMSVMMVTGMVSGVLTPLQSAETQEQFNEAVAGLQQSAMGLMMGGGGGIGGPPPGFGGDVEAVPGGDPGDSQGLKPDDSTPDSGTEPESKDDNPAPKE